MIKWPIGTEFDPKDTKDYVANWTPEMDARSDTLVDVAFAVDTDLTGLSIQTSAIAEGAKKAIVWITAADQTKVLTLAGTTVPIDHTITTSGGRVINRTLGLKIRDN